MEPLDRMRSNYGTGRLLQADCGTDPVALLASWVDDAGRAGAREPNAMSLATVDASGRPSVRMVLCKGIDPPGASLRFFTNLGSRKSRELAATGVVAACFWWPGTERQVRVVGGVHRLPDDEADRYFASRPPESRRAATASRQSRPIASRAELEAAYARVVVDASAAAPGGRPGDWGGWRISVDEVEFWQGREHRLHDRVAFRLGEAPPADWREVAHPVVDAAGRTWWRARLQP